MLYRREEERGEEAPREEARSGETQWANARSGEDWKGEERGS